MDIPHLILTTEDPLGLYAFGVPDFPDQASPAKGVHVFVPYRLTRNGLLDPYDINRADRDLETLREQLAPTLIKLAQPGAPRSVRRVSVRSVRRGQALTWKQDVKVAGRHRSGGPIVRREIVVDDGQSERGMKIVELDYQKAYHIPDAHDGRAFPAYFRARGGGIQLGVSLRLKRSRPDVRHNGSFYYPLGVPQAGTGCAVSLSAPFQMNADRTALVDPGNSQWNKWLLDALADFTVDLLVSDWFSEFGAAAYLAVDTVDVPPDASPFAQRLQSHLEDAECWPTRARAESSRRPLFVAAPEVYIGASPALDAIVSDRRRLHARLEKWVSRTPASRATSANAARCTLS